jgi:hypothetical protein
VLRVAVSAEVLAPAWDFLPISAGLLVEKNATEAANAVMRARRKRL